MRRFIPVACGAVAAAVVLLAQVPAQEQKIKLDKVPKAVMDTVKAKFPDAKLLGASTEQEGGKTVYEISLTYKGHHHDVSLEANGKLVSIERQIAAKDLPKVVLDGLETKYPKAKHKLVEELINAEGKLHAYEVLLVTTGNETIEVVLDPAGKITKEEKKAKKKDSK